MRAFINHNKADKVTARVVWRFPSWSWIVVSATSARRRTAIRAEFIYRRTLWLLSRSTRAGSTGPTKSFFGFGRTAAFTL